jgi:glutamine synthetase
MITAFGPVLATPFAGLVHPMRPVAETELKVDFGGDGGSEHFLLADLVNTDGTPWACCLRNFLARAVEALKAATGLRAYCAFEQEFVYTGAIGEFHNGYTFDAFRRQGPFAGTPYALAAAAIRGQTHGCVSSTRSPAEMPSTWRRPSRDRHPQLARHRRRFGQRATSR